MDKRSEYGPPRGVGPEFTASGGPRETYGSGDRAFPPISAPARPPSPRLSTLRNHTVWRGGAGAEGESGGRRERADGEAGEHKGRKDRRPYPKQGNSWYHLSKIHDATLRQEGQEVLLLSVWRGRAGGDGGGRRERADREAAGRGARGTQPRARRQNCWSAERGLSPVPRPSMEPHEALALVGGAALLWVTLYAVVAPLLPRARPEDSKRRAWVLSFANAKPSQSVPCICTSRSRSYYSDLFLHSLLQCIQNIVPCIYPH